MNFFPVKFIYSVFISALFLSLLSCSKPKPDDQQIMDTLAIMTKAVKEKKVNDLMLYFDAGFRGQQRLYKSDMRTLALYQFRAFKNLGVVVSKVDIKLKDKEASVTAYVLLAGTDAALPQGGRLLEVESSWRKEKDHWLIYQAKWKDVVGEQRQP
ncbi:MAG: hypothetical protein OEZ33_04720 [Gammaproteobacteria bacterium]|nr:hypothetical protein [Gammaproteobacteria bacterium]MDH5777492.1 hypothetical protein [Gammaproteobacteria bacterium]